MEFHQLRLIKVQSISAHTGFIISSPLCAHDTDDIDVSNVSFCRILFDAPPTPATPTMLYAGKMLYYQMSNIDNAIQTY